MKLLITLLLSLCCINELQAQLAFFRQPIIASGLATNSVWSGLIGTWDFDATTGNETSIDPNALVLVANNSPGSTTGVITNSRTFKSGSTMYFSIANQTILNPTNAFTWSSWVYITNATANLTVASKFTYNVSNCWSIQTGAITANELTLFIAASLVDSGTTQVNTTDFAYPDATWFLLSVVYDGSQSTATNRVRCYKNATSVNHTTTLTLPASLTVSAAPLLIGELGGLTRPFNGRIDLPSYWNRALSSTEISTLYNGGAGRRYPY